MALTYNEDLSKEAEKLIREKYFALLSQLHKTLKDSWQSQKTKRTKLATQRNRVKLV